MPIMRDEQQACLAELNASALELVERYEELLDREELSGEIRDALKGVLSDREAIIERLDALQRERGDLPEAGDPDRALLESLGDWASELVPDNHESLIRRLGQAEEAWLETTDEALAMDWDENERRALKALREHVMRTCQRLEKLRTG